MRLTSSPKRRYRVGLVALAVVEPREVPELAGLWALVGHLPDHPLVDLGALAERPCA